MSLRKLQRILLFIRITTKSSNIILTLSPFEWFCYKEYYVPFPYYEIWTSLPRFPSHFVSYVSWNIVGRNCRKRSTARIVWKFSFRMLIHCVWGFLRSRLCVMNFKNEDARSEWIWRIFLSTAEHRTYRQKCKTMIYILESNLYF